MVSYDQVMKACKVYEPYVQELTSFKGMREVLETYEQSKWVKFDARDKSTHPELLQKCLIVTNWTEYVAYFKNDDGHYFVTTNGKTVILVNHWMPLHMFKELNK